jgi:hypothetical protein
MKTIAKVLPILCLGSMLCLAETFSGKVIDAGCKDQGATAPAAQSTNPPSAPTTNACEPTASTTSFGIELSDGKVLKLDGAGNTKVADLLKNSSNKSSLQATVTGSLDGQTVKVDTVDIK